ncbi:MAG: hypothetical protein DMG13_02815 [Acidobacteria bacterium]|nr:MAG: hypothetical protein DMG13_02815 [Acidobacteriota bacterium]
MAMEINIREWQRGDLAGIQKAWLEFCRQATRSDMRLKPDCEVAMTEWLAYRFKDPGAFGFIAESNRKTAGFLIGRVGDWESAPPVIEPRKLGIIDAVYVNLEFRRRRIGIRLVERALQTMRDRHAVAVETVYDAWNDDSAGIWRRAGFAPWMVHGYRML